MIYTPFHRRNIHSFPALELDYKTQIVFIATKEKKKKNEVICFQRFTTIAVKAQRNYEFGLKNESDNIAQTSHTHTLFSYAENVHSS